eukprot:4187369-Pyramimonas_sp.AAC.1
MQPVPPRSAAEIHAPLICGCHGNGQSDHRITNKCLTHVYTSGNYLATRFLSIDRCPQPLIRVCDRLIDARRAWGNPK